VPEESTTRLSAVFEPARDFQTVFTVIPFQCKKKEGHFILDHCSVKIRALLRIVF
jgi:hypothetical protein